MNRSAWVARGLLSIVVAQPLMVGAQPVNPTPTATTARVPLTHPQPLDPQELLQVQAIGGSLLRAKSQGVDSTDTADVLQQLQILRAVIEQVTALTSPAVTLKGGVASQQGAQTSAPGSEEGDAATSARIAAQLSNVREARLKLQGLSVPTTDATTRSRRNAVAAKLAALETATQQALSAPATDRPRLLFALRERLRLKSLRDELAQGTPAASDSAPTPTLTTLIQHR
ncbi:MAG TPA: hypothetical protein VJQ47_10985 [Steroidobacteraceae bacterium]|nr:hypothetical protein [Steroidobacteraceae bacterium]